MALMTMTSYFRTLTLAFSLVVVAACSQGNGGLMNIRNTEAGPDEFGVLPTRPLEIPSDLSSLPTPAPGVANRTDPRPAADAIAALGGNVDAGVSPGQAADLLGHVARFGAEGDIRAVLAQEDEVFRTRNRGRILERAFNTNQYFAAYRSMSLNQFNELERLRRAGVRTPTAPPQNRDQ